MSLLLQDLRDAARHLRTRPGFAAVVVLTLSMGIGLNAAVFTAVDAALLRTLPYAEPERLVHLYSTHDSRDMPRFELAWPTLRELQQDQSLFAAVGGYNGSPVVWNDGSERFRLPALQVTANFFDVLGVRPQLGRTFLAGEDVFGGPRAVVLTDAFWRTRMGADPAVLGRSLVLDERPYTIVGVLPPGFPFAPGADARVVLAVQPRDDMERRRSFHWINGIARLRDGTTLHQTQQRTTAFADELRQRFPADMQGISMEVVPLRDVLVGRVEPVLVLLFACVTLVLLVACANVANLLLARGRTREQEMAVRAALGAGRRRLLRQLLTESLVLAVLGGLLGLLAARLTLPLLLAGIPSREQAGMPFLEHLDVDGRVLLYGGGLILLTTVLFGLLPALRSSRPDLHEVLKESGAAGGADHHRHGGLRGVLVAVEVALAVMLLGSAGLMGKSLLRVLSTDPGYRPEGALGVTVVAPDALVEKDDAAIALQGRMLEALAAVSGVSAATRVSLLPGTTNGNTQRFLIEGRPAPSGAQPEASYRLVGPDYFRVLGIPVLAGRAPGPEDTQHSMRAVVVNRTLQRRFFPGEDVIGKTIRPTYSPSAPVLTIVGVVGDQTFGALDEAPPAILYYADTQFPENPVSFVLRSHRRGIESDVRKALLGVMPEATVLPVRALTEVLDQAPSMFLRRYPVFLLGVFAAFALVLAAVGIFGVVSYGVVERTREFGIRMAVGAGRRDIVRLVLRQNLGPVLTGAVAGALGSVVLAAVFRRLLFGVSASDPGVLAGVVAVLALVAIASALLPALRAARVDPATALRSV
jgi:putative ABC transport system permease protein